MKVTGTGKFNWYYEIADNNEVIIFDNEGTVVCGVPSADINRLETILRYRRERDELDARIEKEAKGEGETAPF